MVNKHYTVQQQKQQQTQNSATNRYSPPPIRNSTIISDAPNPITTSSCVDSFDLRSSRDKKTLEIIQEDRNLSKVPKTKFGRNITLGNKTFANSVENDSKPKDEQQRFVLKDHLSINDIGRFQYILQMDKEMGTHPDSLYRVPSRAQMPSTTTSSINSTNHHVNFWKAGSESPMTSSTSDCRRRRQDIYRYLKDFWKYVKWPLLLLLCVVLLGTSIYFLVADSATPADDKFHTANSSSNNELSDRPIEAHVVQQSNINFNKLEEIIKIKLSTVTTESVPELTETITATTSPRTTTPQQYKTTRTTITPSRNTQILEISTRAGVSFEDDLVTTTEKMSNAKKAIVQPTKDTFGTIAFTSGHQNSFGVPIEEDERILKILNDELIKYEENETTTHHKPTTDASIYRPRVSPTLPVILHGDESTTEHLSSNATDAGQCESTSLSICRGTLQYDLTISKSKKLLTSLEQEHFKYLIDSKCSARASEFVCSALEPECRPSQMGILQPCKRICKSILEPCASIIASSEILTTTFDCDSYPDSSDRNVCEDPTRRTRCHDNEFKCLDSSCIPLQWKCDNIKDCSLGEDEENCLFCEHEEFRCQSNDKCIPDKWRCDQYNDCPDGSDEADCYDYDEESANADGEILASPREFSFASVQAPDSPNGKPYLKISNDDQIEDGEDESENYDNRFLPTASDGIENFYENQTNDDIREENEEIQKGEASGRVVVGVPKHIANFQDSKEIMMTSDTETDFKYSTANQTQRTTTARTEELTPGPNQCPDGELRCISGKCITVDQICDKTIDCPDGADEAMCVYKE